MTPKGPCVYVRLIVLCCVLPIMWFSFTLPLPSFPSALASGRFFSPWPHFHSLSLSLFLFFLSLSLSLSVCVCSVSLQLSRNKHLTPLFRYLNALQLVCGGSLFVSQLVGLLGMDPATYAVRGWWHFGQVLTFDTSSVACLATILLFEHFLRLSFQFTYPVPPWVWTVHLTLAILNFVVGWGHNVCSFIYDTYLFDAYFLFYLSLKYEDRGWRDFPESKCLVVCIFMPVFKSFNV